MPGSSIVRKVKQYDRNRQGIPGEHWLALAAGIFLIFKTRNNRSVLTRTVSRAAGAALIARAASGRDGLAGRIGRMLP